MLQFQCSSRDRPAIQSTVRADMGRMPSCVISERLKCLYAVIITTQWALSARAAGMTRIRDTTQMT